MQSQDFVEGVSGWRMSNGKIELYGGPHPVILGKTDEPSSEQPFVVEGDRACINTTFLHDGTITNTKIGLEPGAALKAGSVAALWSMTMETTAGGQKYAASFGLGESGVTKDGQTGHTKL